MIWTEEDIQRTREKWDGFCKIALEKYPEAHPRGGDESRKVDNVRMVEYCMLRLLELVGEGIPVCYEDRKQLTALDEWLLDLAMDFSWTPRERVAQKKILFADPRFPELALKFKARFHKDLTKELGS